jgi:hypothetical protein
MSSSSVAVPGFAHLQRTILATLATVALGVLAIPASAAAGSPCTTTTTWTGATDSDWNVDTNWTNNQPTATTTANVPVNGDPDTPTVSTPAEVACEVNLSGNKQLNVIAGGSLNVSTAGAGTISAPAGTNVNITGGELKFNSLLVDIPAGFSATGGAIAGTLNSTAANTTLTNAGATYGTLLAAGDGVTLGANVNLTQTADITMTGIHFLDVKNRLYTLVDGADIANSGGPPTLNVDSGGIFRHQGTAGSTVGLQFDSDGTIEDTSTAGTGLRFNVSGGGANNLLGGTLHTTNAGAIELAPATGDSITLKAGGVTVSDQSSATDSIRYAPVGDGDFILNSAGPTPQTVTLLNGDFTYDGSAGGNIAGTGTFTRNTLTGGQFRIKDGDFETGANVTISSVLTAVVAASSDWTNTFTLNVNGTLLLSGTNVTASDAAETPLVNVNSPSGLLTHTGANGLFEPRIVSNGTIQDDGNGTDPLLIQRSAVPGQINLYSGTLRTTNSAADLALGTEIHRLQGGLTMDTSNGTAGTGDDGTIRTAGAAELDLNGNTLTLQGTSLDHASGTITGSGTIAGPGTLYVTGGNFAGGGTMNINAPTVQSSATNIGGFGSELRVGGDWTSNAAITQSETATMRVVSAGTLRHTSGSSTVSVPLTVDGTVDVDAGQLVLSALANHSGTTLTGGTYKIASGASNLCVPGAVDTLNASLEIDGTGSLTFAPVGCASNALSGLSTIGSAGSLTLIGGHSEDVAATLTVNGTLGGVGFVIGNVVNNGDVTPGTSAGTLDINGNYTQGSGGQLNIEVAGTGAGQFDVLDVDGNVTLNGTLALLPINGYDSAANSGDSVSFLPYNGTRTGAFSDTTVTPPLNGGKSFSPQYDDPGERVLAVVGDTFKIKSLRPPNKNKGTRTLVLKATGPGDFELSGDDIKEREKSTPGGKVRLKVKATGDAAQELNQDGEVTVEALITFTPDTGDVSTKTKDVKLKKN